MTQQDRETLKSFFRDGAIPDAAQYGDLIDSTVNRVDDGFEKSAVDGLKLSSIGRERRVMSLYEGLGAKAAAWVFDHGSDDAPGALHLRAGAPPPADPDTPPDLRADPGLTLAPGGNIGVGRDQPAHRLDVAGVARMQGRTGIEYQICGEIPANARWHAITPELTGCHVLEVVAGTSAGPKKGRYALLHAIAMNAYNPRGWLLNWLFRRRAIRAQTAVYGNFADRIRLRWRRTRSRHGYVLEIRTMARFGKGARIRYSITELWHDPLMLGAIPGAKEGDT